GPGTRGRAGRFPPRPVRRPAPETTMAAVDYFLKIDGIEGESYDAKHKGEIDVVAWSWGASQAGRMQAGGGGGGGKGQVRDFHFTMETNKASLRLLAALISGAHLPKAVLTCRKAGGTQQEYLKFTISYFWVTSFDILQDALVPSEQYTLRFSKIEYEYKEQK